MTLPELLARIEELDEKATEGKWSRSSSFFDGALYSKGGEEEVAANADLIAEYRTVCPTLAKIVRKLIEQRDVYMEKYFDAVGEFERLDTSIQNNNHQLEKILNDSE